MQFKMLAKPAAPAAVPCAHSLGCQLDSPKLVLTENAFAARTTWWFRMGCSVGSSMSGGWNHGAFQSTLCFRMFSQSFSAASAAVWGFVRSIADWSPLLRHHRLPPAPSALSTCVWLPPTSRCGSESTLFNFWLPHSAHFSADPQLPRGHDLLPILDAV